LPQSYREPKVVGTPESIHGLRGTGSGRARRGGDEKSAILPAGPRRRDLNVWHNPPVSHTRSP